MPSTTSNLSLCCYHNRSHQLQVARISNIEHWYFERVVFPEQRLLFEAPLEGELEIYSGKMATAVLASRIPCSQLQVSTGLLVESLVS